MAKKILVPIDIHEESSWQDVLPAAIEHARDGSGELHVMTVVEPVEINMPGVPSPEDIVPQLKVAAGERLAALLAAEIPDDIRVHQVVGAGNVHREVLRVADEMGADLIVMASHRPALKDYLLGAHAARVVRHAKCSVHVVRPR